MGDALFCEGGAPKLEWCSSWQKKEEGLESCPSMHFLVHLEERNWRAFEDRECLDQTFKSSFLYLFWDWIRVCMGGSITFLIDFVDWLSSP